MKNEEKGTGIVIIYTAKDLQEFLLFYCSEGKSYKWIAICCPFGERECKTFMDDYCRKSGVFEKVIICKRHFKIMCTEEKMKLFLKMCLNFLIGKRRKYCARIVNDCIGDIDYSAAVVPSDYGVLTGAIIANSKYKTVYILEDGAADYRDRPSGYILKHFKEKGQLIGFLLAKMGYTNSAYHYKFNDTKYCIKYSQQPEKLKYRNYSAIRKLIVVNGAEEELYNKLIEKTFDLDISFNEYDLMFFTTPLHDFTENPEKYKELTEQYINNHYSGKKILVKKHPRDSADYNFQCASEIRIINGSIPGEILIPFLEKMDIISMFTSSVLLFLNKDQSCKVFYYEDFVERSKTEHSYKECFDIVMNELDNLNVELVRI